MNVKAEILERSGLKSSEFFQASHTLQKMSCKNFRHPEINMICFLLNGLLKEMNRFDNFVPLQIIMLAWNCIWDAFVLEKSGNCSKWSDSLIFRNSQLLDNCLMKICGFFTKAEPYFQRAKWRNCASFQIR